MARGEDTRHHPNRKVSRRDDAPAGGIPRPAMEDCASCGTPTPKGSNTCADCAPNNEGLW